MHNLSLYYRFGYEDMMEMYLSDFAFFVEEMNRGK